MKKLLLLSLNIIFAFFLNTQVLRLEMGRYATGQGTQETFNCATDPSGNAYSKGDIIFKTLCKIGCTLY